ncbi:MAG: prenyltransferase [Mycobacteriales bacterium]
MPLRDVPGVLTSAQLADTVTSIAAAQQASGALPWADGHTDPWDHVECAMALTLGGRLDEAVAAYEWSCRTQNDDGAWAMSYDGDVVLDPSIDTNQCAYVAVGVWQWWTVTRDMHLVRRMWPHVQAALDFVLSHQAPAGHLYWSRNPQGETDTDALLTGSSSSYQSVRCGIAIAELLGEPQPGWELAAGPLRHAVARHPAAFLDKSRFSMDWYYPVLGGAIRGATAHAHLQQRWDEFVVPGLGVRCVADRPWVTGAESAELALALAAIGNGSRAAAVLTDLQHLRVEDGSYWTGFVFDEDVIWPQERSSWTAAAVVLASDAVVGGPTLGLFTGEGLPSVGPVAPVCENCSQSVAAAP